MGKVMVTGATGNVGRYVVQELLKLGEEVVCAGSSPENIFDDPVGNCPKSH